MPLTLATFLGEPPEPWRIIAERKIQEWIDAGGPERLPNRGQKLDLSDNPFVPPDLRMAYKVMQNANLAPDWIEIGKDVEAELSKCREEARRFHDAQRRDRIAMRSVDAGGLEPIRERMRERARRFSDDQRARLRHVNGLIDRYNIACPVAHLHRRRLDVEREVAAAVAAPPGLAA